MKMPFLFAVTDGENNFKRFIVKVASCDYIHYDTTWMDDKDLPGGYALVPDVDIAHEKHFFDSESEALTFIRDWWRWNSQ